MDLPGLEGEGQAVPGGSHLFILGHHTGMGGGGARGRLGSCHLHTTARDKEARVGGRPRQH